MKPLSKTLKVYACGVCGRTFTSKDEADAHCVCKCGRPCSRDSGSWRPNDACELCRSKEFLRDATRRVTRLEIELAEAKKNRAERLAEHEKLKVQP
jgi:hypothetical protein